MPIKMGDIKRFTPKWWLTLPFTAKDIYTRLSPKDHSVEQMSYWFFGDLQRHPAEHVLTRSADAHVEMLNVGNREPGTSTTIFELSCILMGMHEVDAKKVIEIGTFNGNTTLNIATNLPADGEVVTIDLPVEGDTSYALDIDGADKRNVTDRNRVGIQFQEHTSKDKIRQVFGDSARLDFESLGGPFDFAFIDGCHDYNYVKSDTDNILKVMRKGGLVMWHDYAEMESVSLAVDEYKHRFDRLCAIEGTRIAMGFVR